MDLCSPLPDLSLSVSRMGEALFTHYEKFFGILREFNHETNFEYLSKFMLIELPTRNITKWINSKARMKKSCYVHSLSTWWYVKRKPLISKVCFCYWCMLSVSFLKLLSRHQNLWSVLPEGFRPVLNQNPAPLCMVHCTA